MKGYLEGTPYPFALTELRLRDKALPERLIIAALFCDGLVIVYALIFSFWLRFQTRISEVGIPAPYRLGDYFAHIALGALAFILLLTGFGIYERNALLRFRFVSLQILKAAFYWATGFIAVMLVLRFEPPISRLYSLIAAILTPAMLLAWRWLLHRYLARSIVAVNLRHRILFIGWSAESAELANNFTQDPVSAYEVVGCLGSIRPSFDKSPPAIRHLGQFEDLAAVIDRSAIDMVILSDVNCGKGDIVSLANTCERAMVQFKVVPSYFQILATGLQLDTVAGIPILGVSRLPLDRFVNILLKRVVDVVGAVAGLLIAAPLVVIFGVFIYAESPGPVFFSQNRMGRRGMAFRMFKLRSMKVGAEKADHLNQSTVSTDPRLLKVGALIRRWNIDEVPQFWNVLRGEMSLVGPRPERIFHSEKLSDEIPHYNARYNAQPGITGWAQVHGLRGDTDLTERINCDLWYLENWNLFLDFQIMFMTFIRNKNAV